MMFFSVRQLPEKCTKLNEIKEASLKQLDQETWLSRTHLDNFVDKNCTILDHIIPYYTIFDNLDNFGPIWTWYEPFWTILDQFGQGVNYSG